MRSNFLAWSLLALCGCAAAKPQKPAVSPEQTSTIKPAPSRALAKDSTFADLVAGLAAQESTPEPSRRCLLAEDEAGFRLEAELAVAIHPLSTPLDELDPILLESKVAQVLSRWGRHGLMQGALKLAALSEAPPTKGAQALVLTDRGAYLRGTDDADVATGPIPDGELVTLLLAAPATTANLTLFVTAESGVSISRLAGLLRGLSKGYAGPIALALSLAPDTALPAPRSTTAAAKRCPDGLGESSGLEGDLSVSALTEGLLPLRARAASCLEHADAGGAAGGRLLLGLRIRPDGGVEQACMIADATEDDALAACVLAAAHDLSFEAPSPAGFVDVELPLVLRANSAPAQPAVCEVTQATSAP